MLVKEKIPFGILCVLGSEVLWGFSFMFTKTTTAVVSPLTLLSWRFIVAFLLLSLLALLRLVRLDLRKKALWPLLVIALFQPVLYFLGETFGIKLTTSSESGIIIACIPIVSLVFSALILKEAPTRRQVAGVGVATAGVCLIVLVEGLAATLNPLGYLMLLVAVVAAGLYSVYSQKAAQFTSMEKTYAMMALGAVIFTGMALVENTSGGTLRAFLTLPFANPDFLVAILYLGIGCSVVAFLLFNMALASIGTNRAAPFAGLATLIAVLAGVVILGEEFSLAQSAGAVLVLGGVYLASLAPGKKAVAVESPG